MVAETVPIAMNNIQVLVGLNLLQIPLLVQTSICFSTIYGKHRSRAMYFAISATKVLVPINQACCKTILIVTGEEEIPL
jgi:hypothetical protein